MTKSRLYLALQAAVCVALVAWLSIAAGGILQEGSARKAEHPMESVYTPEAIAKRFAPIAPLLFTGVGLLIAGLVLGVKDKSAETPVKDAELLRDQLVSRVAQPSAVMVAERQKQNRLRWTGWGLFALCMAPVFVYLLNPAHFPENDLEGMLDALLRVLLPWTLVGLGALTVTSALQEKSVLRETRAALDRLKEEPSEGIAAGPKPAEPPKKTATLQIILIAAAGILIMAGILNGSALDVLYKAITICTECIGLG